MILGMTRRTGSRFALVATAVLLLGGTAGVSGASAQDNSATTGVARVAAPAPTVAKKPAAKKYKTCVALNKVYKHGVAKKGAKDKVTGKKKAVKNFTVDTKTYNLNKKLDPDKDGIACEKK